MLADPSSLDSGIIGFNWVFGIGPVNSFLLNRDDPESKSSRLAVQIRWDARLTFGLDLIFFCQKE
jgi:hypothetical protein